MKRLTKDDVAAKLKDVIDKFDADGLRKNVDPSDRRYVKLAEYERINPEPEELKDYMWRMSSNLYKTQAKLDRYEAVAQEPEEVEKLRQRSMRLAEYESTGLEPEQIRQGVIQ